MIQAVQVGEVRGEFVGQRGVSGQQRLPIGRFAAFDGLEVVGDDRAERPCAERWGRHGSIAFVQEFA